MVYQDHLTKFVKLKSQYNANLRIKSTTNLKIEADKMKKLFDKIFSQLKLDSFRIKQF